MFRFLFLSYLLGVSHCFKAIPARCTKDRTVASINPGNLGWRVSRQSKILLSSENVQQTGDSLDGNNGKITGFKTFSFDATLNYFISTSFQVALIVLFLKFFDDIILPSIVKAADYFPQGSTELISKIAVGGIMLFLSLRSRVFSPLDNRRPIASAEDPVFKERLRPNWQPPTFVFPIVWSIITLLRAYSSLLVFDSTSKLLCPAIVALVIHLSVGDTWNTINNVENRLGTAVVGVCLVWITAVIATFQSFEVITKY